MADAISDILSLTQAFGQFSESVTRLHNTRVQVETAAKSAIINKANYDFMQRFNLNPGDPNRISLDKGDTNYWRDALKDYEGQVETHLGSIKNLRVQNAVRQNLQSSSQDFALKLSNVVAAAEVQRTQEQFIVGLDAYMSSGNYEGAVAFGEAGNKLQLFSPAEWAKIERERILPAKAAILWRDQVGGVQGAISEPRKIMFKDPSTGEEQELTIPGTRGNDFDARRDAAIKATTDLNERQILMDRISTEEQAYHKEIGEYLKIQEDNEAKYGSSPEFFNRMLAQYMDNVHNLTANQSIRFQDTLQRWAGASVEQQLDVVFTGYIGQWGRGITRSEAQTLKAQFAAFAAENRDGAATPAGYDKAVNERLNQIDSWVREGEGDDLYNQIAGDLKFDFDYMSQVGSGSGIYDIEARIQAAAWRVKTEFPEYLDRFMNTVFDLRSKLSGLDQFQGISRYFEGGATEDTLLMNIGNRLRSTVGNKTADVMIKLGKNWKDQSKLNNDERGTAMLMTDAFIAFERAAKQPAFKEKSPADRLNLLTDLVRERIEFADYANKSLIQKTFGNRSEVHQFMSKADQAQFGLWDEAALNNWYRDMVEYSVQFVIKPLQDADQMPKTGLTPITLPGMNPNDLMFKDAEGYLYDVYPSATNRTIEVKKSKNPYKDGDKPEWGNPLVARGGAVRGDVLTGTETGALLAARSGSMATTVGVTRPATQPQSGSNTANTTVDTTSWPTRSESYRWSLPGVQQSEWDKLGWQERQKKYADAGYVWDSNKNRFWSPADIAANKHKQ